METIITGQCKEPIYDRFIRQSRQCSRDIWKDEYCKQHHPDTVKQRRENAKVDAVYNLSSE